MIRADLTPRVDISDAVLGSDCIEFQSPEKYGKPGNVLIDITGVSKEKPLGYIPLDSLLFYYNVDVNKLILLLNSVGISTTLTGSDHHKGKVLYAFDKNNLDELLASHKETLDLYGWEASSDEFIKRISTDWIDMSERLYDVIALAFGAVYLLEAKYKNRINAGV